MNEKAKSILTTIGTWSWPVKFLAGALFSALTGGGILAFLLQHAAYNYALTYGFRPSVEGIPYLEAMVTFGSVSLLLVGAALSIITFLTVRQIYFTIELTNKMPWCSENSKKMIALFRALPYYKALPLIVVISTPVTLLELYFRADFVTEKLKICAWPILACFQNAETEALLYPVFSLIIGVILLVMVWRPTFVWLSTLFIVFIYYLSICIEVLPADGYARLLRTTGFGGGYQGTISVYAPTDRNQALVFDAYILIRSSTHLVVYDKQKNSINEFPLSEVIRISNKTGGLYELPYQLPPNVKYTK